jgi:hypothetical protein
VNDAFLAGRAEYNQLYWQHQGLIAKNKSLEAELEKTNARLESLLDVQGVPKFDTDVPTEKKVLTDPSDDMFEMRVATEPTKPNHQKVPKRAGK